MLNYVFWVIQALCPRCAPDVVATTADAIVAVAPDRTSARQLAVVAFVETGFSIRRGVVPFGATAFHRRHRGAPLVDYARAALASLRLGRVCGVGFERRMVMYLTGTCRAVGSAGVEARRRGHLERRVARETASR